MNYHRRLHPVVLTAFLLVMGIGLSSAQVSDSTVSEPGFVKIQHPSSQFYLILNNSIEEAREYSADEQIALKPDKYKVIVSCEAYPDVSGFVTVEAGKTAELVFEPKPCPDSKTYLLESSYPRIKWGKNVIVHTDKGATILVDGQPVQPGETELLIATGVHTITTRVKGTCDKKTKMPIHDRRVTVIESYNRPTKGGTIKRILIPGLAQIYKSQKKKGLLLSVASCAAIGWAVSSNMKFSDEKKIYDDLASKYSVAGSNEYVTTDLGNKMVKAYDNLSDCNKTRTLATGIAGALFLYNVIDALIPGEAGFSTEVRPDINVRISPLLKKAEAGQAMVSMLQINF